MSRAGWWLCSAGPSSPLLSAETQSSTWVSPPPTAGRAAPLSGSSLAPQARMPKSWLPLPATLPTASASLPPRPAASAVVGVPGSAPPRTASPLLRAGECASATSGAASAPGAQTSASPNRAPPATSIPARSDACASLVPTASSWTWTATIPGSMESAKPLSLFAAGPSRAASAKLGTQQQSARAGRPERDGARMLRPVAVVSSTQGGSHVLAARLAHSTSG